MKIMLSQRNIDLLLFVGRARFTTAKLTLKYFYNVRGIKTPQGKPMTENNVSKILARLCGTKEQENKLYLTRNAMSQKSGATFSARPTGVYFFRKPNIQKLHEDLRKEGRADEAELFDEFITERKRTKTYAQQSLRHELGIAQFFMAYETLPRETRPFELFQFLFTSPNHPAFSQTFKTEMTNKNTGRTYIEELPLNPDGFFFTARGSRIDCFFLEYDTGTETKIDVISKKFKAYVAYFKDNARWMSNVRAYFATQGIDLPESISTIPFRVLFVCESERRRNALMFKSSDLPTSALFWFATTDDVLSDPAGSIWIDKETLGKEHLAFYRHNTDPKNPQKLTAPKLRAWADATVATLPHKALWGTNKPTDQAQAETRMATEG